MPPKKKPAKKQPQIAFFRNLYLYLVCGITIIMILIASIMLVRVALDTYVLKIDTPRYFHSICDAPKVVGPETVFLEGEELEECEARAKEQAREELTNNRKNDVSEALAMLLVAFPIYWFHWRVIQKDHKK